MASPTVQPATRRMRPAELSRTPFPEHVVDDRRRCFAGA